MACAKPCIRTGPRDGIKTWILGGSLGLVPDVFRQSNQYLRDSVPNCPHVFAN